MSDPSTVPLYRQNASMTDAKFLLLKLANDVEITVFGEEGRDTTFKVLAGDHLIVQEDEHGEYIPLDGLHRDVDVEDCYDPA